MKRNLLAASAIVMAIAFSSFTAKKTVDVYMIFNGGTEKSLSSYSQDEVSPGEIDNVGTLTLAWARFSDDNGIVTSGEFDTQFEALDVTNSGNDLLSDETEDHANIEKQ